MTLPDGYHLHVAAPSAEDFAALRREAGLSPVTPEQAELAVAGGWASVHVTQEDESRAVGMGRLIGDGGWMFQVVDMAVLPAHQRRGIGDAVLARLLQEIADRAPAGAYVSMMADPPGRKLYARHGFADRYDVSAGMFRRMP
ncbi:GNAT family N-acetyltransferase [Kocuria palustris]|uniref:GNAT family N-acetyltransferase n=1 Tax=Kocuria palustris TaxID=71999 RepID=UPI00119F098A|nr:GNAT family N-acetyltransferase [Kocuria palustris]